MTCGIAFAWHLPIGKHRSGCVYSLTASLAAAVLRLLLQFWAFHGSGVTVWCSRQQWGSGAHMQPYRYLGLTVRLGLVQPSMYSFTRLHCCPTYIRSMGAE